VIHLTNEEFEKTKQFIIEQQAQFTVDIQRLRESQAQTESIVARLANVTSKGFKDVNAKIDALVDSQIRTDEKIGALADSQMQTAGDLRNLIAVVDRYFSDGRNGNNLGS
jgi:hypothetical protein